MNVYVTGIGIVSAIGLGAEENFRSLRTGQGGISMSASHKVMAGEIKLTNRELVAKLGLPDGDHSRTALLALLASQEAWSGSKHNPAVRTGLISATSVGGIDVTEKYYLESLRNGSKEWNGMVHDNGSTTDAVARHLRISGYIGTISTACSSGANAIMHGARLMESNRLDRVIAGGSDPIVRFDVEGFRSLNVYDPELCKPFDDARKGLNLGEGAAFVVLENEHSISVSGRASICKLTGWNNSADAFHQTASSADGMGAWLSMTKALQKARLQPGQIDYINAHGTGTLNNDMSESRALMRAFGNDMAPFSSTKGFTGHTLAAAGAIEAVFSIMAIQTQSILPNFQFHTPMKETGLRPAEKFDSRSVEHVISNSFGFGGNCSSLVFSKMK